MGGWWTRGKDREGGRAGVEREGRRREGAGGRDSMRGAREGEREGDGSENGGEGRREGGREVKMRGRKGEGRV